MPGFVGRRGLRVASCCIALGCAAGRVPAAAQDGAALPRAAGDTAVLDLGEAVRVAVGQYPLVASARQGLIAARAVAEGAEAARLPRFEAEGSATRYEEPMLVAPLHGLDPTQARFDRTLIRGDLFAGYTLFDGGARSARIRRARLLVGAAAAGVDSVVAVVSERTAKAYLGVLAERQALAARRRQVEAVEAEVGRTQRFLTAGRSARVEVLRARAELANARAERIAAERRLRLAALELARLLGITIDRLERYRLEGPCRLLYPVAFERGVLIDRAVEANPAVRQARLEAEAAAATVAEARAARFPDAELRGRYIEYGSGSGNFTGEWQLGLGISYPIFTGGARGAEIDRTRAEARRALARLELVRLGAAATVDSALTGLREARALEEALGAAVEHFGEVVRIESVALDLGRGTQSDYLRAVADLADARANLAAAGTAAIAARIELARAVGALSPDWLEASVECGP